MSIFKSSLFFLLLLMISSCAKEPIPVVTDNSDIDIGTYTMKSESIDQIPYLDKNQIVFIDSAGTEAIFEITENPLIQSFGSYLIKYDVFEEGDTVRYQYSNQIKNFVLENDSLNLKFNLTIEARPYYPAPENDYVADVLTIFSVDAEQPFTAYQVFYHETDIRTWPSSWNPEPIAEISFLNRIFYNVLHNDFSDPVADVYFNYEYGIVSFVDSDNNLWRFKGLE